MFLKFWKKYWQICINLRICSNTYRQWKEPRKKRNFLHNTGINIVKKYPQKQYKRIIPGDFNDKTRSGHIKYPQNIGKFGKGEINSNGERLAELINNNDMLITNTQFKHKLAHRATWISENTKIEETQLEIKLIIL